MQETGIRPLGWEDPLEEGMATHSSILAWRIPWTEEPGGYSPRGHKESGPTEQLTPSCSSRMAGCASDQPLSLGTFQKAACQQEPSWRTVFCK